MCVVFLSAGALSCTTDTASPCTPSERFAISDESGREQITSSTCEFSAEDLDLLPMIEVRADEAWPDHVVAVFKGKSLGCMDFRGITEASANRVTVRVEGDWRPDGECNPDDYMSLDYSYGVYEVFVPLGEPLGDRQVLMARAG